MSLRVGCVEFFVKVIWFSVIGINILWGRVVMSIVFFVDYKDVL